MLSWLSWKVSVIEWVLSVCRELLLWEENKPYMDSIILHCLLDFHLHSVLVQTVQQIVTEYDEDAMLPARFASEVLVAAVAAVSKCAATQH